MTNLDVLECVQQHKGIINQHAVVQTTRGQAKCQSQELHVTIIPVTSQWSGRKELRGKLSGRQLLLF